MYSVTIMMGLPENIYGCQVKKRTNKKITVNEKKLKLIHYHGTLVVYKPQKNIDKDILFHTHHSQENTSAVICFMN